MKSIADALGGVIGLIGSEVHEKNPGDYTGDDGLLHCGRCHTRKQFKLPVMQGIMSSHSGEIVPVACACQKAVYEAEEERRANEERIHRLAELRKASLMDAKFYDATFERYKLTPHNARQKKICQRYADEFDQMLANNQGMVMLGAPGTGKTFAAACIANALLARRTPLIMTSFVKLVSAVYDGDENEQAVIDRINAASLLVIDDLGAQRGTDYAIERVYNIIDSRYRSRKPMILTTNLSMADMQSNLDIRYGRIYDRVLETCYPLEFTGPSWRMSEASKRFKAMDTLLGADDEAK